MTTILFQGDSITDQWRSRDDDSNLGIGYPTLVRAELDYQYPGRYSFYNRACGGNRSADIYVRLRKDIINLRPDIMSILVGVNDVWHGYDLKNGISKEKYYRIYSMLVEEVLEELPEMKIMIMEPFTLRGKANDGMWEEFRKGVEERAEMARKLAEEKQLIFIPLQKRFDEAEKEAPENFWLKDGVHPTTAGMELLKREWMKGFEKTGL